MDWLTFGPYCAARGRGAVDLRGPTALVCRAGAGELGGR